MAARCNGEPYIVHSISYIVHHTSLMQEVLIFLIFAVALVYLGNRAYRNFSAKKTGCGKGCGCSTDANVSVRSAGK